MLSRKRSLVIVSRENFNSIVCYGNRKERAKRVSLYLTDGHCHTVTRLPAFLGWQYVCPFCTGYGDSKARHFCKMTCYYCRAPDQCKDRESDRVYCQSCNMICPTSACRDRHLASGFCAVRSRCKDCGKVLMKSSREHKCGHRMCSRCKGMIPADHKCYMRPLARDDKEGKVRTYFFHDFESMVIYAWFTKYVRCACLNL